MCLQVLREKLKKGGEKQMTAENKVKVETVKFLSLYSSLVIPEFQRKYVWNPTMRRELIESISDGYPIGALTVFRDLSNTENTRSMQLIDGLQRVITIYGFLTGPSELFNWKRFQSTFNAKTEEIVDRIDINRSLKAKLIAEIRKYYETSFNFTSSLSNFVKHTKYLDIYNNLESAEEVFLSLINSLKRVDIVLPIIIYQGPEESIPEIFDRMNRGSVRLSKYEHYSANWNNYTLESNNSISWLNKFYGLHYASDYLKNMLDEKPTTKTIKRPFDLFLAFSNYLANNIHIDQIGLRLSKETDESRIEFEERNIMNYSLRRVINNSFVKHFSKDELGFELISLIYGYSVTQINKVLQNELLIGETVPNRRIELLAEIIVQIDLIIEEIATKELFAKSENINYLSYFVLIGIFKTKYKIDFESCKLTERKCSKNTIDRLYTLLTDIEKLNELEWFRAENRQVSFLTDKLQKVELILEEKINFDEIYIN